MTLMTPRAGCLAAVPFALVAAAPVDAAAADAAGLGHRQEESEERPRPPTIFDLDYEVEDPEDLIPADLDFQFRWRRIWGALGMRYHLISGAARGPQPRSAA